ncbi:MAG: histidine phosphatase family protein [Clostridium sp.]|uniref:histidine phosphatase family protein n=1 Tax=Clostridium sp. TaxID=1506 RepID=UPI003036744A
MKTTVYLTRHGQTVWNVEGRMQGWNDSPLTELGIKQAEWLKDRLEGVKIDYIYSSSSGRAYETAKIVNKDRNIRIVNHDGLREIKLGEFQGLTQNEIKALSDSQYFNYWNRPELYEPIGEGETIKELIDRVYRVVNEIVSENKGKSILIVTHTMPIKALLCKLENIDIKGFWGEPYIKQTSLTTIEFDGEGHNIVECADTSHHEYQVREFNE